jgi:hypothetical protein
MGRRFKKILALAAAGALAVFVFREPILFVLGFPGTIADFREWRDEWLPMLTADYVNYVLIALNLCVFLYLCLDEKAFRAFSNYATYRNPDRVKSTPRFLKLKHQYDAETGLLSPIARIQGGSIQLMKLCDKAEKGDVEAYYMAVYMFDRINKTIRKYGSSAPPWATVQKKNLQRMEEIHNIFKDRLRQ